MFIKVIGVTPFVGVWIEIDVCPKCGGTGWVTPFVGVWIEIGKVEFFKKYVEVTPFVGVWIEIQDTITTQTEYVWSLPSWECGLKLSHTCFLHSHCRHSLRGSVD